MSRFLRFNVASALGIAVQLAVLWMLTRRLGVGLIPATALAVIAAIVHNFVWHWHWTWADRALPPAEMAAAFARFAAANGVVSLAGNVVLMAAMVDLAGLAPLVANTIAIGVCGVVNYALADTVVFRRAAA